MRRVGRTACIRQCVACAVNLQKHIFWELKFKPQGLIFQHKARELKFKLPRPSGQGLTHPGAAAAGARWTTPGALPSVGAGWPSSLSWPQCSSSSTPGPLHDGLRASRPRHRCAAYPLDRCPSDCASQALTPPSWQGGRTAPRHVQPGHTKHRAHVRADSLPCAARALLPPPADILDTSSRALQRAALPRGAWQTLVQCEMCCCSEPP